MAEGGEVPTVIQPGSEHGARSLGPTRPPSPLTPSFNLSWQQLEPSGEPPTQADSSPGLAYDPELGGVVCVGYGASGQESWLFKNGSWQILSPVVPMPPQPYFTGSPLVYDPAAGLLLLVSVGYTWTFNGTAWANISSTASAGRLPFYGAVMTYDPGLSAVILYGGDGEPGYPEYNSTWSFSQGTWTNVTSSVGHPGLEGAGLSLDYDPAAGGPLLVGAATPTSATWILTGGVWTKLSPSASPPWRTNAPMTYDPLVGQEILYGGLQDTIYLNDTWTFSGGNWQQPSILEPGVPLPLMVYDPALGAVLLQGWNRLPNSTWVGETWMLAPPSSPLSIHPSASASPSDVGLPVDFSAGVAGGAPPIYYAWRFGDGGMSGSAAPIHTFNTSGLFAVEVWVNDSAGESDFGTLSLRVDPPLQGGTIAASPLPAVLDQPVSFTSNVAGGTTPYVYAWNFGDGGTGGSLANITHVYTTNGPFMVTLDVTDASGAVRYSFLNVTIELTARITGNESIGSAPFSVAFTSTVQGGTPAYSYAWRFGDGATAVGASPTHTYTTPGNYQARLYVNDSVGRTTSTTWNVTVAPGGGPLAITVEASPATIVLGNASVVTATPMGGHGTYSFLWTGLPSGCTPSSPVVEQCSPSQSGTYPISVSVTDSKGASATSSTTLSVLAVPPPPSQKTGSSGLQAYGDYLEAGGLMAVVIAVALTVVIAVRRSGGVRRRPMASTRDEELAASPGVEDGPIRMVSAGEADPAEDVF